MDPSGATASSLARFFQIAPNEVLVAHDELDLLPGQAKIKFGGGHAGHNGLRDIHAQLGTPDYWRLRLGIGHPGDRSMVSDYVLNRPSAEDKASIDEAITRSIEVLPLCLAGDLQGAMMKLHTTEKEKPKVEKEIPAEKKLESKPEPKPEPPQEKPAAKGLFGSLFSSRKK